MKKVIVVSKTHLDLGFTDYAEKIKSKYLTQFIPSAIDLAENLNKDGKKNFVWTTGSWLIKEALENGGEQLKQKTEKALREGNIAPHGLAFTTHSELMDKDLVEYNLSIVDKIDKITGVKTIAAKMTDVPGHTKALVPFLANHGIKLLHIGINTAAAYPKLPECFVWKCDDQEVVVIYADGYGGEFKCPYIDEILYFDNAADNHGTRSDKAILNTLNTLKKKYPDYEVTAGRLDDIADSLWNVRDKLPVITDEIGDSWIHGVATDPYKVAAFRTLCNLKNKWLKEGKITKDSSEYQIFADNLLCICEHTWGLDSKMHFCDTEHYNKKKFQKARAKDVVRPTKIFGDFPFRMLAFLTNTFGDKHYTYSRIEKSWAEQREYIHKAVSALPQTLKEEAITSLNQLIPTKLSDIKDTKYNIGEKISFANNELSVGKFGGIDLCINGNLILKGTDKTIVNYRSYGSADFDFYSKHYLRHKQPWAVADNLNPGLKGDEKYPQGIFPFEILTASVEKTVDFAKITAILKCENCAHEEAGAPHEISCEYTLSKEGLDVKVIWIKKDAVRFTESTSLHLYPVFESVNFVKIGSKIDPKQVIFDGDRKLSVIESAIFENSNLTYNISSLECPLVATDGGNIMRFDNAQANIEKHGLTYILHNNLWATNFPLWYEDAAMFTFNICKTK